MKPILYPSTETAFSSNGIGILTDAVSCFVDAELNSVYELEMEYPVDGLHFGEIRQDAIILASPEPKADPQPFRIYRISKPMHGKVRIYARHIVYDLQGTPVAPFKAASAQEAMAALKSNAVTDCPFSFETDKDTEAAMEVTEPKDAWKLLGKSDGGVLSVYGGEYEFDRFTVRLRNRLGEDRGVTIRYGWNLTSADQDENCASVYTGVYPYWKGDDGELITLAERIVPAEGSFDHIRVLPLDLSSYFGEAPTQDQLRTRAERYMRDHEIGVPQVSLTVTYARLSQTEEYLCKPLMEEIRMGDSVTVIFPKMRIHTTSRVVKTRYNVLRDRHESISLGRVKPNISDTLAKENAQRRDDIARLSGGLAAQAAEIEKTQESIRLATKDLIADIGDVQAGLYAIASADDIKGLKEGKTTLFAQIQDDKELLWAGIDARVKSEDFGKYQQAVVDTYATIDDVNSGFSAIATKDEREKWKEAKTTMFAQIGKDTERLQAGINARVTSAEFGTYKDANTKVFAQIQDDLSGCVKEAYLELYAVSDGKGNTTTFADLVADTIALKGRVDLTGTLSVSNGIITSTGQIISQKNIRANTGLSSTKLELDTNDFKMAGKQYYPTEITSTTGAVMALGYT